MAEPDSPAGVALTPDGARMKGRAAQLGRAFGQGRGPARLPLAVALPLVLLAVASTACGAAKTAGTTTTTTHVTSTLPPLPPEIVAYVSLAGTGSGIGSGDEVVPIDVTSGTGVSKPGITVGTFPDAIAVAPDHLTAYVANYDSNSVTPIDLRTDRALPAIPVGSGPAAIAITPDGRTAYVADDGSGGALGDTVTPIDLATRKALPPIKVGKGPQGIAISPDGTTAYVTNTGAIPSLGQGGPPGDTVTPIDLATRRAGAPIKVGNGPIAVAITAGGTAYVANLDSQSVTPITVSSGTVLAPIAVPGAPVAMVATARTVYVVDVPSNTAAGNNVVPISVTDNSLGHSITVPKGVQYIALAPGDATAWVTSLSAGVITPISLSTGKVGRSIQVGGGPFAIAVVTVAQGTDGTTGTGKGKKKKSATSST